MVNRGTGNWGTGNRSTQTNWLKQGAILLVLVVGLMLGGCGGQKPLSQDLPKAVDRPLAQVSPFKGSLAVVPTPDAIAQLTPWLEDTEPQVKILSPKPDETLNSPTVSIRFQVKNLDIYKDVAWGLGPHLHVILDNQPYQPVYNVQQPLVLENLSAGTHTLRVFASKPWHESFKNTGAYAQTTFHILTATGEHQPAATQPLLTYSRPNGDYGAEPVMVDFYLTNAPLHLVAQDQNSAEDWKIRLTVNGDSRLLDTWQPVYIKGLKPGQNWVQLELIDAYGDPIANQFNNTARLITYTPNGQDTLAKLIRGELTVAQVGSIVDPNYVAPVVPTVPETQESNTAQTPLEPIELEEDPTQLIPTAKVPEIQLPEQKILEQKIPETKAPETKAPEQKIPARKIPARKIPETKTPERKIPGTKAPERKILEQKIPATEAPEITLPETKIPEITPPEITPPETETLENQASETKMPTSPAANPQPEIDPDDTAEAKKSTAPSIGNQLMERLKRYQQRATEVSPNQTISPIP